MANSSISYININPYILIYISLYLYVYIHIYRSTWKFDMYERAVTGKAKKWRLVWAEKIDVGTATDKKRNKITWHECKYAYFLMQQRYLSLGMFIISLCIIIVILVLKNGIRICIYYTLYKYINIRTFIYLYIILIKLFVVFVFIRVIP